jgi:hypothetical protein
MSQASEPPAPLPGRRGQVRASRLRSVNLAVRLLCELALLVALAVWGAADRGETVLLAK